MADLENLISQISSHELFLRLKNVIENHEGWHDNEDVFSHCVKAAETAKEKRTGDFIENEEARNLFKIWMGEEVHGVKRYDIVVIAALLHDIGKIMYFREENLEKKMVFIDPDDKTHTMFPGHEYLGGTKVAKKILSDLGFENDLINYICDIVRLHGSLNDPAYFKSKNDWSSEDLIFHLKTRAEGFYIEELFNAYSENYHAEAFDEWKKSYENIFNVPDLYTKREYLIPESE